MLSSPNQPAEASAITLGETRARAARAVLVLGDETCLAANALILDERRGGLTGTT